MTELEQKRTRSSISKSPKKSVPIIRMRCALLQLRMKRIQQSVNGTVKY